MSVFKRYLQSFGFYNHSTFMESSMTSDNIKAMKIISSLSMFSAVMFLQFSCTNAGYAFPVFRGTNILALIVSATVFLTVCLNQKKILKSFHRFHTGLFFYILWLSWCGIEASAVDSQNGGGFIAFLISQIWAFDLLMIPPFVSVVFCGLNFLIFLVFISHTIYFPPAKYAETLIFYVTIIAVNFSHYRNTLVKINRQEEMMGDNARLDQLSTTDSLTSARNRAGLRIDFDHLFSDHLCVMMCDIDNFKKYNDVYGHVTGDEVLSRFAESLRDIFGNAGVYRYGGDEFLIIANEPDHDVFESRAREASQIYSHMSFSGMEPPTSSCGYVYGPCHSSEGLRAMIKAADYQLYLAKAKGKNQISGTAFETQ